MSSTISNTNSIIDYFNQSQLLVLSLNQLRYISVEQIVNLSASQNIVLNPDQLAALGYCNNHCSLQGISVCKDIAS